MIAVSYCPFTGEAVIAHSEAILYPTIIVKSLTLSIGITLVQLSPALLYNQWPKISTLIARRHALVRVFEDWEEIIHDHFLIDSVEEQPAHVDPPRIGL